MWIGSKVPPSIPVRTAPRIGPWRCDQAERPGDVRRPTTRLRRRVDVASVDTQRQMDPWHPVRPPGVTDHIAPSHLPTTRHVHIRQIGDGDLQPRCRLYRHGPHPRHRARERHHAGGRRPDNASLGRGVIDSPMAPVLANGRVRGHDRAWDRRADTHGGDGKCYVHLSPGREHRATKFRNPGVRA